jgi:hypothetical protein
MARRRSARILKRTHDLAPQTADIMAKAPTNPTPDLTFEQLPEEFPYQVLILQEFHLLVRRSDPDNGFEHNLTSSRIQLENQARLRQLDREIGCNIARLDFLSFYANETVAGIQDCLKPKAERAGLEHYSNYYSQGERMDSICPFLSRGPSRFWCRPRFGVYLLDYN